MGKKAREKRGRGSGASPESAPARALPPQAPARASSPPAMSFSWPRWASAGEAPGWMPVAAVFGIALVIRAVLLSQMSQSPYLAIDNIDAKAYRLWAEQILAGEWLPRRHFYQSPLYAYYLAGVTAVFGQSPWAPRIVQVLLGSASAALVVVLGSRLFNRRVGVIAGLLLATYGPMILEEISLAKTVLLCFGGLLGFVLFLDALERRQPPRIVLAGATFGVTIIGVGQWLLALFGLAAYAAWDRSLPRRTARRLGVLFLGAALVPLVPLVAWNSYWGGGFMLTSGDAGLNLYLGNNPLTTGLTGRPRGLRDVPEFEEQDSRRLAEREAGRALTPAGVSRHWSRSALAWAAGSPLAFTDTTRRKLTVLWNSYEIPDSYHFAFIRAQYLPWLWVGSTFAIVGPLALVGLVLAARHRRARPLYVIALSYLAVITLFYVRSRYRMPALPFLMVFAAAAVDATVDMVRRRDWNAALAVLAGSIVAAVLVNHTYCEPPRENAPAICLGGDAWFDSERQKLAEWHERNGDPETALDYLRQAVAGESLRGPGQLYLWIGRLELSQAQRARAAGDGTRASARVAAAVPALRAAVEHGYHVHEAQTFLADAFQLQGNAERALAASDAALRARPRDPLVVLSALRVRVALGRCDDALRLRNELRQLRPNDPEVDRIVATCGVSQPG